MAILFAGRSVLRMHNKLCKTGNIGSEKRVEVFRFSKLMRCGGRPLSCCLVHICFTAFVFLLYFGSYFVSKIKVRAVVLSA